MPAGARRVRLLLLGASIVAVFGCGGGSGGIDHSGAYWVAIGHDPTFTMTLVQAGESLTFEIQGQDLISGTGTLQGETMLLEAPLPGLGTFLAEATFAPDGQTFRGTWEVPEAPLSGTITGSRAPPATWDLAVNGIPQLATTDCIDLDKIQAVSKFRSGMGHDYSDDFESCRSMKHYYLPKGGVDFSTIRIYAPVSGTVIGTTEEWESPVLWKGTAVGIRPDGYEAFFVVLFHVDLDVPLEVGDSVAAGQLLGTSEKLDGTATDLAMGVITPAGFRLLSYFHLMTDAVFSVYAARGVASRDDAVITAADRDADPLVCVGSDFQDPGSLDNWVDLN